ncbi:MAG: C25 family cysteine peptidase [Bacteroidales bacterium]|nr:C25 family cysteine peptidase [Bacteroidales bacterium]
MKKLSLLFVLVMCGFMAMAQNGRIDLRSTSRAEITKSDMTALRAVFSYGSIESVEFQSEKGIFSEIALPGAYPSGEIGTPELPATHELLAVPFGANPTVSIVSFTTTDYRLSDYGINTIVPHQHSVRKDQNPEEVEFVYNQDAYQTRALATAPEASIEVQGTLRGIRVGSLVVNPLSYNAATNTLRVFNDIEVEVSFDGADFTETERMLVNTYSPYFDVVYKQMFNYRQILDVYTDHPDLMAYPVHMLVIAPENYVSTLQPWTNWKTQKGFDVEVYTTSQAGSSYNAIRSFVQNKYNTGVSAGETPTFLILVGDVAQVPNTIGNESEKVTDLYYGSVDNDDFPDMFYSRMSAENTNQLTAIINKVLQYEQYAMPDPSYLNNVTLIAGWDSYWNPRVGQPTVNYATTYYYNTAHGFNQVNAHLNQGQYSGCYSSLSTGVGFVNYTAHGSETSWADPTFNVNAVNSLSNTNKYFLAMGNCCLAADFGYYSPCLGEAMTRAENKGAFSYIGSCPSSYWYEDYYFGVGATHTMNGSTPSNIESSTGVYDAVWMDDTYNTVSSMVFVGNLSVCYAHAGNYQGSVNNKYYWQSYHVLGDGSIMPFRVQPTPNTVSHAQTFPGGANAFTVSAQPGSYVGISKDNVLLGAALVPASGTVNVPITPVTSGYVMIVVTKPQRQPYTTTIPVGTTQYSVTTSSNPTNGGTTTGGGTFNPGQSCTVTATPAMGYTFVNWTENGTQVSTQASYTFNVNGNRNLVANFTQPSYTITTSSNPSIGGSTSGGGTFVQGQSCTVHATPASGYNFVNWTENGNAVSTQANYTFTVNGNRSLVANFSPATYTVTTSSNPINGGTTTGGGTFNNGASCTVTATANPGYTFEKWTKNNAMVSTDASYTFTVTSNCNLVAHFVAETYTVAVTCNPEMGTVSGGGMFTYGQTAAVSASAKPHYVFESWTENGNVVSTDAFYTFNVTADHELVATFASTAVEINVIASPADGGTVTGAGTYDIGETVTLVAEANWDLMYYFFRWTENGNEVSADEEYTFTAEASRNLVAEFVREDAVGENAQVSRIYPNPASDKLNVVCSSNISELKIYNMVGAMVYSLSGCGNNAVVSLADMPNGVYFIQLTTNGTVETHRFVKE